MSSPASQLATPDVVAAFAAMDAAVDAIDGFLERPTAGRRARVRDALAALAAEAPVAGLHLIVDGPRLPPLEVGVGSLRRAAGASPNGREPAEDPLHAPVPGSPAVMPAVPDADALAVAGDGHALGWLIADGTAPILDPVRRSLGLALRAAHERASGQAAAERLAALDEATRTITGVLSLERVLQAIVDRVRELVDAKYAALGIVDATGRIERFLTSGMGRAEREGIGPPPRGRGLLGLIITEGRSFRIEDIASDPRSAGFPPGHPPMHSFLGVPVTVKGRAIGDLYMTEKRGRAPFTADDQRLVETFARHAGIAIENARLHEQVQRLAVVEERERIGKDLHDGIIQSIYAVGLSLEDVPELMDEEPDEARQRVDRAIDDLDKTIRDIRNFIFGLRPELLKGMTLAAGLDALVEEFRVNTMVDVELLAGAAHDLELPGDTTGQLLIITREALSNVARHAKASRATVEFIDTDDRLAIAVVDNGTGFEVGRRRGPGHQGILNMRHRAAGIGGTLEVESRAGSGTRIIVTLPRPDAASGGEG